MAHIMDCRRLSDKLSTYAYSPLLGSHVNAGRELVIQAQSLSYWEAFGIIENCACGNLLGIHAGNIAT